jgi:hypothetical protein
LIEMFIAAVPGGHVVVTRLPYGDRVPDSPEGACLTAAVVVAWVCVGFVTVIAALAQSVVWTIVALLALVLTVACTLAAADHLPFRADSAPSTGASGVGPGGVGEDDERVGSW